MSEERDKKLIARYLKIRNMPQVAVEFGISRERVRQICVHSLSQPKLDEIKEEKKIATKIRANGRYIEKYGLTAYNIRWLIEKYKKEVRAGKRWSVYYSGCIKCGRSNISHQGEGLCTGCYSAKRYKSPEGKEEHRLAMSIYYSKNSKEILRKSNIYIIKRYKEDEEFRDRVKEQARNRFKENYKDPAFVKKFRKKSKDYYWKNRDKILERTNKSCKGRYKTDPKYREKIKKLNRARYKKVKKKI